MSILSEPSIERMFRKNAAINRVFLETLSPADLELQDGQGGQSVLFLLAHMAHFRYGWVRDMAPACLGDATPTMERQQDGSAALLVREAAGLQQAFLLGDEALLRAVREAQARGEGWQGQYPDPTMILARTAMHDAHHRGQIKTLLRQHGVKYPALNTAAFGVWGAP